MGGIIDGMAGDERLMQVGGVRQLLVAALQKLVHIHADLELTLIKDPKFSPRPRPTP